MLDNADAVDLGNRDAIINFSGRYHRIRTKYLDDNVILKYISSNIESNHNTLSLSHNDTIKAINIKTTTIIPSKDKKACKGNSSENKTCKKNSKGKSKGDIVL